jgi:hypothetical protein
MKGDKMILQPLIQVFFTHLLWIVRIHFHLVNVGTDEMLIAFIAECDFRSYIINKPIRYGINIVHLTNAHNLLFYNCYTYNVKKNTDRTGLKNDERKLR